MAIIGGFKSTTVWNAFILNSLATSIAIVFALEIKMRYDTYVDSHGNEIQEVTNPTSFFITFIATFAATFFAYTILHVLFGYGTGQLAD
jgi:hypothetical protein